MLWKAGQAYLSKIFNIIVILLYPVSTIEHFIVGPRENISKIKVHSWLETILIKVLANIVQIIIALAIHFFNYFTRVM